MAQQFRARLAAVGIRERLVLLVLAMLLPWIAIFATTYVSYQRDLERDTHVRLRDLAAQVGARVDDQLGTVEGLLVAIAEGASADTVSIARNDAILGRLRAELPPYITSLALWGADGHNIGSSDTVPGRARKMEVATHRFFREALAATHLTVGRPIESHEIGGWSLTMARRIRQDGAVAGVASVSARLDSLGSYLAVGGSGGSSAVITLLDDDGRVLARAGGTPVPIGTRISAPDRIRRLRDDRSGFVDSADARMGYAYAFQRVTAAPWLVIVSRADDVSPLANEPEWRFLALFGALGLGGALFLAALVAARIADPLRKLTTDAARFGSGDLGARTDLSAPGEVGVLAATFNNMAATLEARTAALAASEERHRLAARATNDVIWDWDIRTSVVEWSDSASAAFGATPEELGRGMEWWSEHLHPEDRDATTASLTDALDSDTQIWTAEYRFRCGDGTYAEMLAFCSVLGYAPDELMGTPVLDLIHPDDRAGAVTSARTLETGVHAQRYENRLRCKDGSYKWLGWMVQTPGKEHGLVYAVARDITEQKRAEERLRASEEWYRLLFDANPLPMWVYDIETLAFLAVNDAAIKHYGYSRSEFLGMRITDIRPDAEVPRLLIAARAPDSPEFDGGVWQHRTKDGRIISVEVVTHALTVLDRPARLTLAHDVTERQHAERALRETNDTLQTLIQASPLAIVTTDLSGTVSEWNVAAERMFGWFAGDVLGRPIPIVPVEQLEDDMRRLSASGEHSFTGYETRCARKDGTLVDVYVSTAALRGVGGMLGTVWVIADVTERKMMEEQLRQAQKMDAVGQLAGGVAHDFNNLLTVITSYGQFLLNALPEQDPRRSDAHQITQAAARAASLTRQLLAFSRRQVLQPQVLDLNEVIGDMERLLRRVISEDIALVTQFESGIGAVRADRGQIEQVVMNLVVNARDAMPNGGVLAISTRLVHLDTAYARRHAGVNPGKHVVFAVRDTGVGMDASTQQRIFEPFFTTKGKGKGTGLGLSTVYGIVRQSGGHIDIRSAPGRGTTFEIILPQVAAAAPPKAEHVMHSALPRGTETVLVVEDEEAVRLIVRRVLRDQGYEILEARDGNEALRICAQKGGSIDLVLSDVIMPGMGGRELSRALAASRPGLPILFMSGYNDDGELAGFGAELGPGVLAKPFTAETLATQVREALDRRPSKTVAASDAQIA